MIEYKGYGGVFEYDPDDDTFRGRVVNLGGKDGITFSGSSVEELRRELTASVEDYLAWCAERGEAREKPFNGNFLVRTDPELHRAVAVASPGTQSGPAPDRRCGAADAFTVWSGRAKPRRRAGCGCCR